MHTLDRIDLYSRIIHYTFIVKIGNLGLEQQKSFLHSILKVVQKSKLRHKMQLREEAKGQSQK